MNASVFFVKRRVREASRRPEPMTSPILHRGTRGVPRPADPLYPGRPTPSAGDATRTVAYLGRVFRLHLRSHKSPLSQRTGPSGQSRPQTAEQKENAGLNKMAAAAIARISRDRPPFPSKRTA